MTQSAAYPHLFQPIEVGTIQLGNRIVWTAMMFSMDPRSEQWRAFVLERAKGGFGAIIHGSIATDLLLDDNCWGIPNGAVSLTAALRQAIADVHQAGSKFGLQLLQASCYPQTVVMGSPYPVNPSEPLPEVEWVSPSDRVEPDPFIHGGSPVPGLPLRSLTVPEIEDIIDKYVKAAAKAKAIGFDFVEIHGAHGVMPCQFLSPLDNVRNDRYGGSLEARMRFGIEIVEGIKSYVGKDFTVFYRPPGEDNDLSGGITLSDTIAFSVALEKAGVDCLDPSIGLTNVRPFIENVAPLQERGEGVFVPYAKAIKRHVQVPVIGVGNIRTPEYAESLLADGKVDIIGLGRQPVADPEWPNKVKAQRTREIITCDSCGTLCWRGPSEPTGVGTVVPYCKLNKEAGREWEETSSK